MASKDDENLARKLGSMHFPAKLMHIVDSEEDSIIRWAENGACFVIVDLKRFENETLPRYFHHSKFASFQRQLNLYGFRRISRGPSQGFYFHPSFHANRPDLLAGVKRLPRKTSKHYAEMVQQRNDLLQKQRSISEQVRLTQSTDPLHKELDANASGGADGASEPGPPPPGPGGVSSTSPTNNSSTFRMRGISAPPASQSGHDGMGFPGPGGRGPAV
eukprot:CAMPEP_0118880244 /NCGR_PEP_ID=MMETSP1163-20130328/19847_1 /TAXON_ID=124430 /ORGANISM="Phaeomonas parva, Strain CCMP2877" /LENGTH=216 /DNA_ID=CAMNT_0006816589 /DNA_START=13 /DNA_END=660 /DNA_ORIENTATION=-